MPRAYGISEAGDDVLELNHDIYFPKPNFG